MTTAQTNAVLATNRFNQKNKYPLTLYEHLLTEASAMIRYAFSNGLEVPADVVGVIGLESNIFFGDKPPPIELPINSSNGQKSGSRAAFCEPQSIDECNLVTVESNTVRSNEIISAERYKRLADTHQRLTKIVSPATPGAIRYLDEEKRIRSAVLLFLGPIPLIRRLSIIGFLFLVSVIGIGSSDIINVQTLNTGILESSGTEVIYTQIFLLCCAGLGACFNSLFKINNYIATATYDPKFDSTYLTQILLGLIAGLIIVELLPKELFQSESMSSFGKATLAVLAGYSAHLVYQVLQRLADTLESLIKGDRKTILNSANEAHKARISEERTSMQSQVASKLVEIQNQLGDSATPEDAKREINKLVKELLPAVS